MSTSITNSLLHLAGSNMYILNGFHVSYIDRTLSHSISHKFLFLLLITPKMHWHHLHHQIHERQTKRAPSNGFGDVLQ